MQRANTRPGRLLAFLRPERDLCRGRAAQKTSKLFPLRVRNDIHGFAASRQGHGAFALDGLDAGRWNRATKSQYPHAYEDEESEEDVANHADLCHEAVAAFRAL